ncbi:11497_t:CDS:2 [Dentiscutata erythropus]|uniref:11497_t:CDS:1 n=1 Tax=Dentiscutata erythropus TaxID=1348616 RepID=A0A9N9HQ92_9GLOM|nr:11497_t:CDS:2 [Dentiscutata erythropus]
MSDEKVKVRNNLTQRQKELYYSIGSQEDAGNFLKMILEEKEKGFFRRFFFPSAKRHNDRASTSSTSQS